MVDFGILEQDGWEELDDVQQAISSGQLVVSELWGAVGAGDTKAAVSILQEAGWNDLDETEITSVHIISIPDDLLSELYRIWVRVWK